MARMKLAKGIPLTKKQFKKIVQTTATDSNATRIRAAKPGGTHKTKPVHVPIKIKIPKPKTGQIEAEAALERAKSTLQSIPASSHDASILAAAKSAAAAAIRANEHRGLAAAIKAGANAANASLQQVIKRKADTLKPVPAKPRRKAITNATMATMVDTSAVPTLATAINVHGTHHQHLNNFSKYVQEYLQLVKHRGEATPTMFAWLKSNFDQGKYYSIKTKRFRK
jgi:hypothetical protein